MSQNLLRKGFDERQIFATALALVTPHVRSAPLIAGVSRQSRHVCEGDTLVIWKHGRRGRSLGDLVETVNDLKRRAVGLRSLTEPIDTTTSGGRLISHVFGALGQFERDLIRERTKASYGFRLKASGRVPGGRDHG